MLRTQHLYEEIQLIEKAIEAEKDGFKKNSLKAQILQLKMLHSLRTNMVQIMRHFKIPIVTPKDRQAETNEEKE